MRAKTILIVVAAVMLAVAVGTAWSNTRRAQAADAALAAMARNRAAAADRVRSVEVRLAGAEKLRLSLQAEIDARQTSKGSLGTTEARPKVATTATEANLHALLKKEQEAEKDPKIQLLNLAVGRARMATTYGLLFRTLGLLPEQIEKFQDIASLREEQTADLRAVMREQGLTLKDPALAKLSLKVDSDYQAAQKELLGEAGYRQLADYERAAPVRNMVSGYAGAATVTGVPFTAQQAEQLTQLLTNASSAYREGGYANPDTIDWPTVDAQAGTILSDAQLTLIKTIEPPGGGRFAAQVAILSTQAQKADTASSKPSAPTPPGG